LATACGFWAGEGLVPLGASAFLVAGVGSAFLGAGAACCTGDLGFCLTSGFLA